MLGFCIRKAFYNGWDNIPRLAVMNLVYVLLFLAFYLAGGTNLETHTALSLTLMSIIILAYCVYSLGVYKVTYSISKDIKPDFDTFKHAISEKLKHGLLYYLMMMLVLVGVFFVGPAWISLGNMVGYFTGTLTLWVALVALLFMQYYLPLCFYCPEKKPGEVLKLSFAFFNDNIGYSIFLLLRTVFDIVISVLTALLLPGLSGVAVSRTTMVRLLIIRYEYLDNNPGKTKKQADWYEVLEDEMESFGKRNLLDLIFPRKR